MGQCKHEWKWDERAKKWFCPLCEMFSYSKPDEKQTEKWFGEKPCKIDPDSI
jgi:hypothetical protein